jgi:hypothetical protein
VPVQILGFQNADGSISEIKISLDADEQIDAAEVQELIDDLMAARDEANRLASWRG